jgi:hypothetical protein
MSLAAPRMGGGGSESRPTQLALAAPLMGGSESRPTQRSLAALPMGGSESRTTRGNPSEMGESKSISASGMGAFVAVRGTSAPAGGAIQANPGGDASDYGIGGYIFQKDGHTELPIRFISKSLHKSKLNWSTIEKEAFAIFYTVTKYDFLLRVVKFTIETDHKNLTYLKTAQSAKVWRWQLALQEYDFTCIHIAGEANVVADAFSRLCERRHSFDADTDDKAGPPSDVLASMGDINPPPVTTEPSIPPLLRAKIEAVHNSTSGHFGVEYTRKVLLSKRVNERRWTPAACCKVRA